MNKGSSKEVGEQEEEEGSWEDVIRFGNTKAAIDALGRISDTQGESQPWLSREVEFKEIIAFSSKESLWLFSVFDERS